MRNKSLGQPQKVVGLLVTAMVWVFNFRDFKHTICQYKFHSIIEVGGFLASDFVSNKAWVYWSSLPCVFIVYC